MARLLKDFWISIAPWIVWSRSARKAQLIELRFFLAFTMEEAADVLAISLATAERDLKFSRPLLVPSQQNMTRKEGLNAQFLALSDGHHHTAR